LSFDITPIFDVQHNNKKSNVVVAMSVYQGDRVDWLKQSVESILSQTMTEFLFYIVIDGEFCESKLNYLLEVASSDRRVCLFRGNGNVGLSECMNFIIDRCQTFLPNYFVRMDADDISHPQRLEKQLAFMERHRDVDILGAGLSEINENGTVIGTRKLPLTHKSIVDILPRRCPINHPTVLMRYDVFSDGQRYVSGKNITEDYYLWADLAAKGRKFANLNEQILKFRRVDAFYHRRGFKRSWSEFKARFYTMRKLNRFSVANIAHAVAVFLLRTMPSKIVKMAYKVDRTILEKKTKH
jgi:glycosyltransferase involved in cell wall biosynthesis